MSKWWDFPGRFLKSKNDRDNNALDIHFFQIIWTFGCSRILTYTFDVISGWICKPNVRMIVKDFTSRYVPSLKSTSLLCLFLFRGRVPPREKAHRVTSCNR